MEEIKKNRIREAMETVLKAFESNPEKVALAIFRGNGKPSDCWSFFNPSYNADERNSRRKRV